MNAQRFPAAARNLQLDFFRGLAMMIIFINHMPGNPWYWYTPSRFGFSDAAETFVFLSGFASALAYGRCLDRAGLWLGTVRILYRCAQIYAAHLASFLLMLLICVLGNRWIPETDDIQRLNIGYFFDHTQQAIFELFSLAYVPNYFDILPLYLVLLLWLPLVWALSRLHSVLALGCSVLIYFAAQRYGWELTAHPMTGRPWHFNPFNWQLLFFTGFGLGAGWLRIPGRHWILLSICALIVLVAIPLSHEAGYGQLAFFNELHAKLEPMLNKHHLGLLRWVHLLALAYLMNQLFKSKPHWLTTRCARLIITMGQQSLAIFLCCMGLSYIGGIALDGLGHGLASVALVNLTGLAVMLAIAQLLAWLNSKPWKLPDNHSHGVLQEPSALNQSHRQGRLARSWCKSALQLLCLIGLALLPMQLLQTKSPDELGAKDLIAQSQGGGELQKVSVTVPSENLPKTAKQQPF